MDEPPHLGAGLERSDPAPSPLEPNRLYIGNQTAFSAKRLMDPFEYAVANGFTAFEWFPDRKPDGAGWDGQDLEPAQREEIRRTARAHGIRLSVHSRCCFDPLQEQGEPLWLRDAELARDLGASVLVLHLRLEEQMLEIARALLARLRGTVAAGFQIALENTPGDTPGHFGKLFALLRELNPPALPRIGMCLDIGHANLCPATRNDYLAYLGQLDDGVPIIHVHVHENWGDADSHLTLFTGPAAYDSQGVRELLRGLRRRGFAGSMILEQWPQPPTLLNRAHDRLLEIWRALDQSPVAAPLETSSTPGKLL